MLFNGVSTAIDFTFNVNGGTTQCVNVLAVDDDIMENPEVREAVMLSNDAAVQLFRSMSSFVIVDNDGRVD